MAEDNPIPIPEMVERVARALHAQLHAGSMAGRAGGSAEQAWERGKPYGIEEEWHAAARAAIEAMREPSEAMKKAGKMAALSDGAHDCEVPMEDVYRAMIDSALGR